MDRRTESGPQGRSVGAAAGFNAPLLIVLGTLALTALLYWPTSLELVDLWGDTDRRRYTHGWLVLAVTVWLIWRDRRYLGSITPRPPLGGWLLVALGSISWLVGYFAGLLAVSTLAMPMLVLVTVWAAGGLQLARRVAFPILLLYFALPVWELINPLLQWMTAVANYWLANLVGIPVVMNEFRIDIPAGSFLIAGGCSGLHFFIVALFIATVQGEMDRDDLRSRIILLLMAGALALVTNWLRVFIIIVAGHLTDMQHFLVKVDHYYFGWVLFAFALVFYFYASQRVEHRGEPASILAPPVPAAAPGRRAALATLSIAALALGPVWALATSGGTPQSWTGVGAPAIDGWLGPAPYDSDWKPVFANADEEFLVVYQNQAAAEVALYFAAYHSQRQGKELLAHRNTVTGTYHRVGYAAGRTVTVAGSEVRVSEQIVRGWDGGELLVWWTFGMDGRPDPMDLRSRLEYGLRSLFDAPTASIVAFAAECRPDCENARAHLGTLAPAALSRLLPGLRSDAQ